MGLHFNGFWPSVREDLYWSVGQFCSSALGFPGGRENSRTSCPGGTGSQAQGEPSRVRPLEDLHEAGRAGHSRVHLFTGLVTSGTRELAGELADGS